MGGLDWGALMSLAGTGGGPQQLGGLGPGMVEAPGGGYQPEGGAQGEKPAAAPKGGGGKGGGGGDAGKGMQPMPDMTPSPPFQPIQATMPTFQGPFFNPSVPQYLQSIGQILNSLQGMSPRGR